jgi:hypothetical protein
LDEIDGIITDYKINREILEKYSEKTDIIIASPDNIYKIIEKEVSWKRKKRQFTMFCLLEKKM